MVQLMAGESPDWLRTVPLPVPLPPPATFTVNGPFMKRAVTFRPVLNDTWQVPLPVHPPSHLLNACPGFGVAVKVTVALVPKLAVHPDPVAAPFTMVQLIPEGVEVTVPSPVPFPDTTRVPGRRRRSRGSPTGSESSGASWQAWIEGQQPQGYEQDDPAH